MTDKSLSFRIVLLIHFILCQHVAHSDMYVKVPSM